MSVRSPPWLRLRTLLHQARQLWNSAAGGRILMYTVNGVASVGALTIAFKGSFAEDLWRSIRCPEVPGVSLHTASGGKYIEMLLDEMERAGVFDSIESAIQIKRDPRKRLVPTVGSQLEPRLFGCLDNNATSAIVIPHIWLLETEADLREHWDSVIDSLKGQYWPWAKDLFANVDERSLKPPPPTERSSDAAPDLTSASQSGSEGSKRSWPWWWGKVKVPGFLKFGKNKPAALDELLNDEEIPSSSGLEVNSTEKTDLDGKSDSESGGADDSKNSGWSSVFRIPDFFLKFGGTKGSDKPADIKTSSSILSNSSNASVKQPDSQHQSQKEQYASKSARESTGTGAQDEKLVGTPTTREKERPQTAAGSAAGELNLSPDSPLGRRLIRCLLLSDNAKAYALQRELQRERLIVYPLAHTLVVFGTGVLVGGFCYFAHRRFRFAPAAGLIKQAAHLRNLDYALYSGFLAAGAYLYVTIRTDLDAWVERVADFAAAKTPALREGAIEYYGHQAALNCLLRELLAPTPSKAKAWFTAPNTPSSAGPSQISRGRDSAVGGVPRRTRDHETRFGSEQNDGMDVPARHPKSLTPSERVSLTPSERVSLTPSERVSLTPSERVSPTHSERVSLTRSERVTANSREGVKTRGWCDPVVPWWSALGNAWLYRTMHLADKVEALRKIQFDQQGNWVEKQNGDQ